MALDDSITAYFHYLALGLPPGGFVTAILLGNIGDAYSRAHPHLFLTKSVGWAHDENVVSNLVHVIREYIPYPPAMNSWEATVSWISHEGMKGFDDHQKAAFILEYGHTDLAHSLASNYESMGWLRS